LEVKGTNHLIENFHISFNDGGSELNDGIHDEGTESSLKGLSLISSGILLPLLGGGIIIVITPKFLHKLVGLSVELGGINVGESGNGEGPTFLSGTEGGGSLGGVNLKFTHIFLLVSSDNDINHINTSDEVLIHGFSV